MPEGGGGEGAPEKRTERIACEDEKTGWPLVGGGPGLRPHQAGLRWDLLCCGTLGGLGKPEGPSQNNVFNTNEIHWFTEQTSVMWKYG